eukprot:1985255-Pyramimonas_sp.AAC.1
MGQLEKQTAMLESQKEQEKARRAQKEAALIGTACEYTRAFCVRLVRRENIPALSVSDWSVVRIYPRFL